MPTCWPASRTRFPRRYRPGRRDAPEVRAAYGIPPAAGPYHRNATDWENLAREPEPVAGPAAAADLQHDLHVGHHRPPKGVRRQPHRRARSAHGRLPRAVVRAGAVVRTMVPGTAVSFRAQCVCAAAARAASLIALMPRFDPEVPARWSSDRIEAMFMVPTCSCDSEAAGRGALPLRSVVAEIRMHAAAPPIGGQAGDDPLAGTGVHEFYGSTESGAVTVVDSKDWLARPGTVARRCAAARCASTTTPAVGWLGRVGEVYTRLDIHNEFTYHQLPDKRAEIDREGFITSGDVAGSTRPLPVLCDRSATW